MTQPIVPAIRRVLDASVLDGRPAVTWLLDPKTDTVRKACLLNILAVLCVTPTKETPLIADVLQVFTVKADRIYVTMDTDVRQDLEDYVADVRMPFYHDPCAPEAIHALVLANLPEDIAADGLRTDGPYGATPLDSYRAEGAPSLQIVIADSPYDYTVADIDLDAHNPLQDVVGFIGHMSELITGHHAGRPTDSLDMRDRLSHGPAASSLCYTLGA